MERMTEIIYGKVDVRLMFSIKSEINFVHIVIQQFMIVVGRERVNIENVSSELLK